ncbi:MAG: lysostaphin resistance A-like protein [Tepidisphaeraceae bacterium]
MNDTGAARRNPEIWPVFVGFAGLAVAVALVACVWVGVWLRNHGMLDSGAGRGEIRQSIEEATDSRQFALCFDLATAICCASIALLGAGLSPMPWRQRLMVRRSRTSWATLFLLVLGTIVLGQTLSASMGLAGVYDIWAVPGSGRALAGLRGSQLALTLLVTAGAAAIGEELFFRGFMLTRLTDRWGFAPAVMVTSVLFGILHMNMPHAIFATGFGLYLGWIVHRSGSIRPAILCHATNNVAATMTGAFVAPVAGASGPPGALVALVWTASCAVIFGACLMQSSRWMGASKQT